MAQSGKIIRLSLAIVEGKFSLGINALKLLFYIIDDFANYINSEQLELSEDAFEPRSIYVSDIDFFDTKNLYETVDKATNELMSAFIVFRKANEKKFTKVQWFRKIEYSRGYIWYQFDSLLHSEIAKLNGGPGGYYVGISPVLLRSFYSALAIRLYLLARLSFVRHSNCFSLSPWELADEILQKPSYYPIRAGYEGGSKYAIGDQKKMICQAIQNINEDSDISVSVRPFVNKKGAVNNWVFDFVVNESLGDKEPAYVCIANGSDGQFPVKLTDSELSKIKKEFPNNWENLISDLAEYQEMHGFIYYHPLYPIRRYASTGNPNKRKLRDSGRVDPPKVFYHGKAAQPSDQFFDNLVNKYENESEEKK